MATEKKLTRRLAPDFCRVLEDLDTAIWVFHPDYGIPWGNRAAQKLWMKNSLKELQGVDFSSDSEAPRRFLENNRDLFLSGGCFESSWVLYPNNIAVPVSGIFSGIFIENEELAILCQAYKKDISDAEIFRSHMSTHYVPVIISIFSLEGELVQQNALGKSIYGTANEHPELWKNGWKSRFVEDADRIEVESSLKQNINQRKDVRVKTAEGIHWHSLSSRIAKDPTNGNDVILFVEQNIDDLKQTESNLNHKNEQLTTLSSKLSKYLSPQLYDSIFQGKTEVKIQSQQKRLTVFFLDIVSFTPTVENMQPDALTTWLNQFLNNMANIALKYGATIDKFIGDAVMIFFGDPETLGEQEDAYRCVQMAIEMQAFVESTDIQMRIGIATGDCTVGNFGSEDRMDYTIIGPVVNQAARLEANSRPGKILISEMTYHLVKDKITCDFNDNIKVKGFFQAIPTYWVTS